MRKDDRKLQKLGNHTEEEGAFDISFNFLANPKSHSCNNQGKSAHFTSN